MDRSEFLNPGPAYRGITLWMLNDELELDEIGRQIEGFHAAGWGAVITRTFVGLRTKYLGDEWMAVVEKIIALARDLGMKVWLQAGYMPSGIPDLDPAAAHKVLVRRPKGEPPGPGETVLHEDERYAYCQRLLDHVLDLLNAEAVSDYLVKAYERPWLGRFAGEFGKTVEAIWVDEPHFRPPPLPWSDGLPARFRQQWGYSVTEHLPSLFAEAGDFEKVRHHYWRTVLDMFLEAYFRPVRRWCDDHDVKFSGHLMGEDTLNAQIAWTGAAMPCYEEMGVPGIDHLTMSLTWPSNKKFLLTPKQCSSAANQLGKPEILAEMYGVSSQGITFQDRKAIGDWMALLGINYRCYHGSFYSIRGRRKRIYVPHLSCQQPWWPDNRLVADYFARLSCALRQGTCRADVLVLHPVESAFCVYDPTRMERPHDRVAEPEAVKALDDCVVRLCDNLMKIHRGFEFGDETLMAKYGEVTGDALSVGRMTYRVVVLPSLITLRRSTVDLLTRFAESGGRILSVGRFASRVDGVAGPGLNDLERKVHAVPNEPRELRRALDAIIPPEIEIAAVGGGNAENVWLHTRRLDEGRLCFLANTSRTEAVEVEVRFRGSGKLESWDLPTGEVTSPAQCADRESVVTELSLPPLASHLFLLRDDQPGTVVPKEPRTVSRSVPLSQNARIRRHAPNALTLDKCRFRKADGPWSEPLPVIYVQSLLEQEGYQGPVTLQFSFTARARPKSICVVVEDARNYTISVNGRRVEYAGLPYYLDRSFHPVDVTQAVRAGENVVELSIDFRPVPKSKFVLASLFESHSGVELESIYLTGDFAVRGTPSAGEQKPNCVRRSPEFVLADEEETSGGDLVADGYPFFAGRISLVHTVGLQRLRKGERVILSLPALNAVLARVRVNGADAGAIVWPPCRLDISPLVEEGDNEIDIEFVSSLRNLLGAHHRSSGEPDNTWGTAWAYNPAPGKLEHPEERDAAWTDDYFFLPFGLPRGAKIEYLSAKA